MKFLGKALQKLNIPGCCYINNYLLKNISPNTEDIFFIFIIGPPRVGSTLLYQILVASNIFDYINNFEHAMYKYPALGCYLSVNLLNNYVPSFQSFYGYEKGLVSPSEANSFWSKWLGMNVDESRSQINLENKEYISKYFKYRYKLTNKPFLSAWNAHAFYLKELNNFIKNRLFIHVLRDPLENALSILNARNRLKGSIEQWWSLKPAECNEKYFENPFYQVMAQIYYTNYRIEKLKDDSFLTLNYTDICSCPLEVVNNIAELLNSKGYVNTINYSYIPSYFPKSNLQIPSEWEEGLLSAHEFFYGG